MEHHHQRRLFLRYREQRDYDALTELFDQTAPSLMALAVHLTRDVPSAQDLVQATFLTAIERNATFDAQREIYPWLAGILVNQARQERRQRDRLLEADRLVERAGEHDPAHVARGVEVAEATRRALEELPEIYRNVLVPYLEHARAPHSIAAELELAPGTVRVRIHRGLEMLRGALPASFGAASLAASTQLAGVRRQILKSARRAGGAPAASGLFGLQLAGAAAAVLFVGAGGFGLGVAVKRTRGALALDALEPAAALRETLVTTPTSAATTTGGSVRAVASTAVAATEQDTPADETAPAPYPATFARPAGPPTTAPPGMIEIPGGRTYVGSEVEDIAALVEATPGLISLVRALDAETPQTRVVVDTFFLAPCELTNEQYEEFVRATGHRPPLHWGDAATDAALRVFLAEEGKRRADAQKAGFPIPPRRKFDQERWWSRNWRESKWEMPEADALRPVIQVDYADALAYCRWAGLRLPAEGEFQRAARGMTRNAYPWGPDWQSGELANTSEIFGGELLAVGSFPRGASPYGILDLAGNVWEWTASPYVAYPRFSPNEYTAGEVTRTPEPTWEAKQRVAVGGSWQNPSVAARVTARRPCDLTQRSNAMGFRPAATPVVGYDLARAIVDEDARGLVGTRYAPAASAALDRWTARASEHPGAPAAYRVLTGYEHLVFVPVEMPDSQDVTLRKMARSTELTIGLLATSIPLLEPKLAPGTYRVVFQTPERSPYDLLSFVDVKSGEPAASARIPRSSFGKGPGGGKFWRRERQNEAGEFEPWLRLECGMPTRIRNRVWPLAFDVRPDPAAFAGSWRG
ncbi:MAG: sigma-70 family RNA polymerase sigma factor [bacterium]|nr:sigma-70 family RNA polymerase sigma factor [bacterium]